MNDANDYCDNPDKNYEYIKDMSPSEYSDLIDYCKDYEYSKLNTKGKIKEGIHDFGEKLENLPDIISLMIHSMFFTEEGRENMALIMGVMVGPKIVGYIGRKLLPNIIKTTLEETLPLLGRMVVNFGAELLVETGVDVVASALVSTVTTEMVINGVLNTLPVIGQILDIGIDAIFAVLDVLMILGMALDIWDPFGYSKELNAKTLSDISDSFNNIFMKISTFGLNLPEGDNWPIQYYADGIVANTKLDKETEDELAVLRILWSVQYLQSLEYNSLGNRIIPYGYNIDLKKYDVNSLYHARLMESINHSRYVFSTIDSPSSSPFINRFIKNYWFIIVLVLGIIFSYFMIAKNKN